MPLGAPSDSWFERATGSLFGRGSGSSNSGGGGWIGGAIGRAASAVSAGARPQPNPMLDWLNSQAGASNGYYGSLMSGLGAQLGSLNAYSNNQANSLQTQAGLAGNLLNQQRYRDVTLGRQGNELDYRRALSQHGQGMTGVANALNSAQQQYGITRDSIINQNTGLSRWWDEERRYIDQLRGFNSQDYDITSGALNYAGGAATRDLGELNRRSDELLAEAQKRLGLTNQEIASLRQMSTVERDQALQDVAAARGFNQREYDEMLRSVGAERGLAGRSWEELQRDLTERRGTTDEQVAIQRWLNEQNVGSNDAALNLGLRQAAFQEEEQRRAASSDAIARGAMTSRGHGQDLAAFQRQRGFADEGTRLQHDQTSDALSAQLRGDENAYQAALDQLTAAYNSGQIGYDANIEALLARENQGRLGYDMRGRELTETERNARTDYQNMITQLRQRQQEAEFGFQTDQSALRAGKREGKNQYDDIINQIDVDRQRALLGFQQGDAALDNRYTTSDIERFNRQNSITTNSRMNRLGLSDAQANASLQQRILNSDRNYAQGQYNLQNDSLRSLGQSYGTRGQQAQAQLQQALTSLRYGQSQGIAGLNQQRAQLAQQQQNALQQLLGQASGYGGRYY